MKTMKILSLSALFFLPLLGVGMPEAWKVEQQKFYRMYAELWEKQDEKSVSDVLNAFEEFYRKINDAYGKIDLFSKEGYIYDDVPQVLGSLEFNIKFLKNLLDFYQKKLTEEEFEEACRGFQMYGEIVDLALKKFKKASPDAEKEVEPISRG